MFPEYNRAIDTIEELVKEHSIDCDFQRSGKLTLAMNAKQVGQMRKTQQTLAELADYSVTVVDKQDLHSEIGSDFYAGGMVDPLGAGVHVGKFVHGLAEAGARAGVTICENAQVTQLAARAGGGHDGPHQPRRRACRPGPDRDQRLHRIADAVAPAADHPGRQLHHRDRAAAAGDGPADPAQPTGRPPTTRCSPTTSASRRTTGCSSGAGPGSRCPAPTPTSRAPRSSSAR